MFPMFALTGAADAWENVSEDEDGRLAHVDEGGRIRTVFHFLYFVTS
jgi:hypothetical protein